MNVTGLDVWTARLVRAATTIKPRVDAELETSIENIAETMRSVAPRDTGALVESISYELGNGYAEAGASVPYAHFVEYGTVNAAPQPFASVAAEEHQADLISRIEKVGGDI